MKKELIGFDDRGQVFELAHVVYRKIQDEYKSEVTKLYQLYNSERLDKKGIVETSLLGDGNLEHRKITISYPYEWTPNMLKDAALFHIQLFAELDRAGLTLKDALLNNIVFNHTSPVFVDFLSLVLLDKLKDEAWLNPKRYRDPRFAVVDIMLLPYIVIPLLFMAKGEYAVARELLSSRSCNCGGKPPSWGEFLRTKNGRSISAIKKYIKSMVIATNILWNRWVLGPDPAGFEKFIDKVVQLVKAIDVTPPKSAYSFYYDEKKEETSLDTLSSFLPKQKTVYDIISIKQPKTVLDIGANTGWYSVLVNKLGAEVISLEHDESCVDILYDRAKRNRLDILPLKVSFSDLTKEIYGVNYADSVYREIGFKENPLYRAGVERFNSELILLLGLAHHLVLGEGHTVQSIFEVLSKLTTGTLVLEYVDLCDEKIVGEMSFFKNLNAHDRSSYNIDIFIREGMKYFKSVMILRSNPDTRKILVFEK